jgi:purine nucleosidase
MRPPDNISVLLDTDIGSDIDDAVALAYLLRQPRCELVGVTTVSGEPHLRASLADAVCRAAGRDDVAVHVGIEPPLRIGPKQPRAEQAEALTEAWPHGVFAKDDTAVMFLRDTIRSRPGEITLLPIGPLTNIATLFTADPEIPSLLREIVLMGGRYFPGDPGIAAIEWNIQCDPDAAAIVFGAPVPKLTAVGLDVTTKCRMPADECRRRFAAAGGPLAPVAAMAEIWFRHRPEITFHDPLAAALIFEPRLCTTEAGSIVVELGDDEVGTTRFEVGDPRHVAALTVDAAAFFAHYFEVAGRA